MTETDMPDVVAALTVGPEDKLVLTLAEGATEAQANELAAYLGERLGKGRAVVLRGVTQAIAVQPGDVLAA